MPRKKSGVPKQTPPKPITVATHLPEDAHELYLHCLASWTAIKADTVHFATPATIATETEADITGLGTALQAAEGGDPASKSALKVAANKVRQDFQLLAKYVQGVLRAGPIEDAPAILSNILMYASNVGQRRPKPVFDADQPKGTPSGSVLVTALAVLGALTYHWESSTDQLTWSVFTTGQAHATLTGLAPGKTYYFRFRAFRRDNTTTSYSQTIELMVK